MDAAPLDHSRGPAGLRLLLRVTATGSAVLVAGSTALALAWHVGLRATRSVSAPGPARPEDVVVVLAAVALGVLVLRWLAGAAAALTAAALAASARPSVLLERASARLAPPLVRRLAAAAVGIGVLGAAGAPASASAPARPAAVSAPLTAPVTALVTPATPAPTPLPTATTVGGVVQPGGADGSGSTGVPSWPQEGTPWRASAPAAPVPATRAPSLPSAEGSRGADREERDVVVRRGDTLWSIAARALPAGTGASGVALEWPRWWTANRDVVGDDPDLLLPGQVLRPPVAGR